VRHDQLLAKVARRIQDATLTRLLKQMLKSTGKKGVISPLLSNLYLNEVDRMLEKARRRLPLPASDNMPVFNTRVLQTTWCY
jgi:hypothetical protein